MKEELKKIYGNKVRVRVCGVCTQDNAILLINHLVIGEKGSLWAPPGGGLDYGESIEACLIREFKEETGLDIRVNHFLFVNEFIAPPLHAIELFYKVSVLSGTIQKGIDPEMSPNKQIIAEIKYWPIEEIAKEDLVRFHKLFQNSAYLELILSSHKCN